jgi:hypothetical protein
MLDHLHVFASVKAEDIAKGTPCGGTKKGIMGSLE